MVSDAGGTPPETVPGADEAPGGKRAQITNEPTRGLVGYQREEDNPEGTGREGDAAILRGHGGPGRSDCNRVVIRVGNGAGWVGVRS